MPSSKSNQRTWIASFAEETGVFGLNVLRSELSKIETVFWILCVVILGAMTARDLASLSNAFLSKDTVTLASREIASAVVFDPAPTFGFRHALAGEVFKFDQLSNETSLEEKIDQITNATLNETKMDEELFQLTTLVLLSMFQRENEVFSQSPTPDDAQHGIAAAYANRRDHRQIAALITKAYDRYRLRNVNFSKLMRVVAAAACKRYGFTMHYRMGKLNKDVHINICLPENVITMTTSFIVLKLLQSNLTFSDYWDHLTIEWTEPDSVRLANPSTKQAIKFDAAGTSMTRDEPGDSDNTLVLEVPINRMEEVHARVTNVFVKAEEKVNVECSNNDHHYDCKQRCHNDKFVRLCSCWPMYYSTLFEQPANVSECAYAESSRSSLELYLSTCVPAEDQEGNLRVVQCHTACLQNCKTKTLAVTTEQSGLDGKQTNGTYQLRLRVRSFVYQIFEEKLKMSSDDFWSQFGGALGLYLGVSVAALVHIPVFAVRMLAMWYQNRQVETKKDAVSIEVRLASRLGEMNDEAFESFKQATEANIERLFTEFDAMQKSVSSAPRNWNDLLGRSRKRAVDEMTVAVHRY